MEKFIVSARKYRPQNFSTVVGQEHITTTLKNAIRNEQLAHAFLFCGPRGVGKTTCARILAKTINCENLQPDGEACNSCQSCVSFNNGNSMNIHELDAASNNSVEDIRTLTDQVRFAPQAGRYKVYIIDEVHMLSASAFNAFLKTLEEPPPYAIFILATTEKHKILPTILSRCQIFDFKRITLQDTVEHLDEICRKEGMRAEKAALQVIAQKSEGCMRDALSILDKIASFTNHEIEYRNTLEHLNILDEDQYFRLLDFMLEQKLADAMLLYDDINNKGFEGDMVLNGFAEFLRNLMVCRDPRTAELLEAVESFRAKYISTAQKLSLSWVVSALSILNEAEISYKQARNKRLHVELALIKLTYLGQAIDWAADGSTKKKLDNFKAVSFRPIRSAGSTPVTPTPAAPGPKLIVEEPVRAQVPPPPRPEPDPAEAAGSDPGTPKPYRTLGEIRKQVAGKQKKTEARLDITEELLHQAWGQYVERLIEQKNPTAANNMRLAGLRLTDGSSFEVLTETPLQQKFIEAERGPLIEHLQEFFGNRQLKYSLVLEEKPDADPEKKGKALNSREQYLKMIEIYPAIKDLKDRLGLELDY
jgi:DNA polymerase III subunit gamma/tau